jgi:hypothetical protein
LGDICTVVDDGGGNTLVAEGYPSAPSWGMQYQITDYIVFTIPTGKTVLNFWYKTNDALAEFTVIEDPTGASTTLEFITDADATWKNVIINVTPGTDVGIYPNDTGLVLIDALGFL